MTPTTALVVRMTYQEFLTIPYDEIAAEWVNGSVVPIGEVDDTHQETSSFLHALLRTYVEENRIGELRHGRFQMKTAPDLPGREPDLLFVANRNLHRLKKKYLEGPADLVVEITSNDSLNRDRGEKFSEYEKGGVTEYWIIDPTRQIAEFYNRDEDGLYRLSTPDANGVYRSCVLEHLWIQVEWLWQSPPPRLLEILSLWGMAQPPALREIGRK